MNKIKTLILFVSTFAINTYGQIESISFYTDYSSAFSTRLQVTRADAVGGGVKIKFTVADNFSININSGYKLYSINEPDVLNNWGWVFWTDRYFPKIVSDLNADANLSVNIYAVQKMDLIPLSVSFGYDFIPLDKLIITPTAGAGVNFFSRRMYAVENWSKYFPDADYFFSYSYRNFAPAKKGNPFFVNGEVNIQYRLYDSFSLFTNVRYTHIIPTEGSFGYDGFPVENEISLALGLAIYY